MLAVDAASLSDAICLTTVLQELDSNALVSFKTYLFQQMDFDKESDFLCFWLLRLHTAISAQKFAKLLDKAYEYSTKSTSSQDDFAVFPDSVICLLGAFLCKSESIRFGYLSKRFYVLSQKKEFLFARRGDDKLTLSDSKLDNLQRWQSNVKSFQYPFNLELCSVPLALRKSKWFSALFTRVNELEIHNYTEDLPLEKVLAYNPRFHTTKRMARLKLCLPIKNEKLGDRLKKVWSGPGDNIRHLDCLEVVFPKRTNDSPSTIAKMSSAKSKILKISAHELNIDGKTAKKIFHRELLELELQHHTCLKFSDNVENTNVNLKCVSFYDNLEEENLRQLTKCGMLAKTECLVFKRIMNTNFVHVFLEGVVKGFVQNIPKVSKIVYHLRFDIQINRLISYVSDYAHEIAARGIKTIEITFAFAATRHHDRRRITILKRRSLQDGEIPTNQRVVEWNTETKDIEYFAEIQNWIARAFVGKVQEATSPKSKKLQETTTPHFQNWPEETKTIRITLPQVSRKVEFIC